MPEGKSLYDHMKIDFETLEKLAAAGATAQVLIEFLRLQDEKRAPKRKRERARQQAKRGNKRQHKATAGNNEQVAPTIDEGPRARCFRICKPILVAAGVPERRAGSAIGQWLKATHDDAALVTRACEDAQRMAMAEPISWINAAIRTRTGNGAGRSALATTFDDLIARAEGGEVEADADVVDITPGRA